MSRPTNTERLHRNDESRNRAGHHRDPWSDTELEVLMEWNGTEEELEDIADLLGRTIEACRQRYYCARRGDVDGGTYTRHQHAPLRPVAATWDPEDVAALGDPSWYVS